MIDYDKYAAEALLPCPFCNGNAEFERKGDRRQSCIVACTECGARLESNETWDSGQSWNLRAAEPEIRRQALADAMVECDNERIFAEKWAYTSSWKEACEAIKQRLRALHTCSDTNNIERNTNNERKHSTRKK